MSRKTQQFTPLELEIMKVLWAAGPGSVQDVQAGLGGDPLAYTTVQTMLNILVRKGKVKRVLKGRAYVYQPSVRRLDAVAQTVSDLIDRMFGGSAEELVMGLLETKQLTPERLKELQKKVEENQQ
jgi:BlaI family transcriptional regulator, penicillinase repressor